MRFVYSLKHCMEIAKRQGIKSLINFCVAKCYTLKYLPDTVKSYPVIAQIETTNICNIKCKMCAHVVESWRKKNPPKNLSLDEFKLIVNQLPYIQYALISGVGEPLLNPHILDMIQYAHCKGVKTGFFTNAVLLTPNRTRELLNANGLADINVSIDAGKPESYESIRVGAKFSEVCNNIESFIKIRAEMNKKEPVLSVYMVVMRENVEEIPLLIKTVGRLGVRYLRFHSILESEDTEGNSISREEIKLFEEYERLAAEHNVVLFLDKITDGSKNKLENRTCKDPWRLVYVNVDGKINPCCYSYYDDSGDMGNIFKNSLDEIWNNMPYRNFRHELKTGMPDVCKKCQIYSIKSTKTHKTHSIDK